MKTNPRVSKFMLDYAFIDGRKLDFEKYEAFKLPYEVDERQVLLTAGRQVGKTVYLAGKLAVKSVLKKGSRALYVAPLESQTKTFSKTKLQKIIDDTKQLKAAYTGKGTQNDVFFKQNILGSYIELTYASVTGMDPVRVRGKSADDLFIDEAQDIDYDILPAIQEVTTSAEDPTVTYAGTAKSLDNTTGVIWDLSTKLERMVYCKHCGHWNILDRRNISKEGLVCNRMKCRRPISVRDAKWMITGDKHATYQAFRIPQICLPMHTESKSHWNSVWNKYVDYPPEIFNQEILGIPSGAGDRLLNLEKLKALCTGGRMTVYPDEGFFQKYHGLFMGIDWTGDGVLLKSRTVATVIGHRKDGKLELVWGKIFPPGSVNEQPKELIKIANLFRCSVVGADAGMGMMQNGEITQALGISRFRAIQYIAGNTPFTFDFENNTIKLNKTQAIDTVMMLFLKKFKPKNFGGSARNYSGHGVLEIVFPEYDDMRLFIQDILAEFEQETAKHTKIWTHSNMKPDDTLHAIVFGFYAYMHHRNTVSFY